MIIMINDAFVREKVREALVGAAGYMRLVHQLLQTYVLPGFLIFFYKSAFSKHWPDNSILYSLITC